MCGLGLLYGFKRIAVEERVDEPCPWLGWLGDDEVTAFFVEDLLADKEAYFDRVFADELAVVIVEQIDDCH